MKNFIIGTIILMGSLVGAQATTIILKDGRSVSGDIIEQNKNKVILKEGDVALTYYKDDIASIDSDDDKGKLVQEYIALSPTSDEVSDWIEKRNFPPDQKQVVLSFLNNDRFISTLTELRRQGLMEYLSTADLKAIINFHSSPEGQQYFNDLRQFKIYTGIKIIPEIKQGAKKAIKNLKKKQGGSSDSTEDASN